MTKQMNIRYLCVATMIAVAVVWGASAWAGSLPTVSTFTGYLAVLAAAAGAWRLNRWRSAASAWVLLVLWTVLATVGIADLHCYASHPGASIAEPWFANPDSDTIYRASAIAAQERFVEGIYNPRSIFFGLIYMAFGPSPAPMIMAAAAAIIVAVSCAGVIAGGASAGSDDERRRLSAIAMGLTAAVCHLTAMGTVLLKDAFVIAGISLFAVALLRFIPHADTISSRSATACGLCGILLLFFLRFEYLIYIPIGLTVMLPWTLRRKKLAGTLLVGAAFAGAAYYAYRHTMIGAQQPQYIFDKLPAARESYNGVAAWILSSPWWVRVACLPATAAVQYLIPLPWTASADAAFGPGFQLAHFSLPWYILGGLIITSLVYRRRLPAPMLRITLLGLIIWIIPAYLTAGLVNRYTLSAVPLMASSGAYAWLHLRRSTGARVLYIIYLLLLAGALGAAYFFTGSSAS